MGNRFGKILGIRTNHRTHNPLRIDILDFFLPGDFPITQNRDVIANPHQLFQTMRDVDDCHALTFQLGNDLEKNVDFGCGKRRCRLIHNDDTRINGDRLGDFYELLLPNWQIGDKRICTDASIEPVEIFVGFYNLCLMINAAHTAHDFAGGKDILCNRHV